MQCVLTCVPLSVSCFLAAGPDPSEPNFLDTVGLNFDRAAAISAHDPGLLRMIKTCDSVLEVNFPVKMVCVVLLALVAVAVLVCC